PVKFGWVRGCLRETAGFFYLKVGSFERVKRIRNIYLSGRGNKQSLNIVQKKTKYFMNGVIVCRVRALTPLFTRSYFGKICQEKNDLHERGFLCMGKNTMFCKYWHGV
ncbi:MAG TPA: hypothetical protein DCY03_03190, partial [Planctomycetaceae bacterium]|nr:hypothetical protein [Planctomycetaceae bacterium]